MKYMFFFLIRISIMKKLEQFVIFWNKKVIVH